MTMSKLGGKLSSPLERFSKELFFGGSIAAGKHVVVTAAVGHIKQAQMCSVAIIFSRSTLAYELNRLITVICTLGTHLAIYM